MGAWLIDGPHLVTEFRDRDSANWYWARLYETVMVSVSVCVIVYLVKGCRRAGQIFTFDVMFCSAMSTIFWLDMTPNFFQPVLLESSNLIVFQSPCGHIPGVFNSDCGRPPDAVFFWLSEAFGAIALAILLRAGLRRVRRRWPEISIQKQAGLVFLGAFLIDVAWEVPAVSLGLWTYQGGPSLHLGAYRLALSEVFGAIMYIGLVSVVWIFRDDKGRSLVERGLEHHTPRARKGITFFALYGFVQLAAVIPVAPPFWFTGMYQGTWQKMPPYIVNDGCNAPGITGTRYGICPGDPGYTRPGPGDLPGKNP
ncbi:MAG TPA: spirocyclase AveC family protein [Acidimicrobiales bacterium]